MQIAIYSRVGNILQEHYLVGLIERLQKQVKVLLYEPLYRYIAEKCHLRLGADELFGCGADLNGRALCLISVGGDGTMLDAAALAVEGNVPVTGFCTGRLGFLPALKDENLNYALTCLLRRNYSIEYRSMLYAEGFADGGRFALNDICIQKRGSAVAEINVHIDGEFLSDYWADGLIVSTPTGSTAYSLSAGGPIISPAAACFVVVPIAAHNLSARPVVVPDTSTLAINMHTRNKSIVVGLDSKEYEMSDEVQLSVRKFDKKVGFIKFPDTSFYQTLREKLLWGVGTRVSR